MPHIKVKPFDTSILDSLIATDDIFSFRAIANRGDDELLGVVYEDEPFMLEIKKRAEEYLIKPDTISRPLDVNRIKKLLALLLSKTDLTLLHSNIALSTTKPALAQESNKRVEDFQNPLFTKEKVSIEVGFGSGRHLLYQASKNPDTLFIGIEIHTPSAQQVLKQIELQGIDNIWVVNYDARLLLEMIPSNICTNIYVHFPVPWDKKPHRRVISKRFLDESLRVLCVGGELELRTDSDKYYAYAIEVFSSHPKIGFRVEKNQEQAVRSKYEDRWRAQEKDIYTVSVRSDIHSVEPARDYHFEFGRVVEDIDTALFSYETIIKDDYFIHFERVYSIVGESKPLVRVAFGSFDKPEHKYLYQQGDSLSYYPQNPVQTDVNYRAHKHIEELLNV